MATTRRSTRAAKEPGLKRDYSGTEYRESSIYDGPEPTRGLYRLELVHVGDYTKTGEEKPSSVQWTFRIMDGETNSHGEEVAGWKGSKYTTENGAFVEQNILVACGVIEPGENVDLSYRQILAKAKPCRGLLVMESYIPEDGEKVFRAALSANFLPDNGETTSRKAKSRRATEVDDEDEDDEEPPPARTRRGRKEEPEPEPEEEEEESEAPTEEELAEYTEELEELSPADLKARAKEHGVTVKRGMKTDAIIDAILADVEENGFPEEEEEEEPEEDPEEEPEPPKSRRAGRSATSARSSGSASKARGSKRGFDDEPPF